MNWMPRFVLPDGTVVLPEQVDVIWKDHDSFEVDNSPWTVDYDRDRHVRLEVCRTDRPTGLTDRNGKAIFERDRVQVSVGLEEGREYTVEASKNGEWMLRRNHCASFWFDWQEDVEVTGLLPYSEEGV